MTEEFRPDYSYRESVAEAIESRIEADDSIRKIHPELSTPIAYAKLQEIALGISESNIHLLKELMKATDRVLKLSGEKIELLQYMVAFHKWVENGCRDNQRPDRPNWAGD